MRRGKGQKGDSQTSNRCTLQEWTCLTLCNRICYSWLLTVIIIKACKLRAASPSALWGAYTWSPHCTCQPLHFVRVEAHAQAFCTFTAGHSTIRKFCCYSAVTILTFFIFYEEFDMINRRQGSECQHSFTAHLCHRASIVRLWAMPHKRGQAGTDPNFRYARGNFPFRFAIFLFGGYRVFPGPGSCKDSLTGTLIQALQTSTVFTQHMPGASCNMPTNKGIRPCSYWKASL